MTLTSTLTCSTPQRGRGICATVVATSITLDLLTKQTAVGPSDEGVQIWADALDVFFQGDPELIGYVQRIVGLAAIGQVFVEALVIAYGDGRNGKSTFWNTIARVLGTYSGTISADALTVGVRRHYKP